MLINIEMKKIIIIISILFCVSTLLNGQEQTRFRVISADGKPVLNATVKLPEGNTLAVSDTLGYFMLTRPLPERVLISHISFGDKSFIIDSEVKGLVPLVLDDVFQRIDEVEISTGFQRIPKERATGSFAFVDNQTFNEQVSSDVLSRLEAVANGLSVHHMSGSTELGIRIRGQSTFSTGAIRNPLIILDNFPYEGDLDNINPNDVENITLLKDAAAASIWGARAGNGVIVITTKRAKQNQPIRINFNANVTRANKPDLGYYDLMSPQDFIEVERFLFNNNHRFNDTASIRRPAFSPIYEILFKQRNGELSEMEANSMIDHIGKTNVQDEYSSLIYKNAFKNQYALDLQGGLRNAAWYLSAGYDKNVTELSANNDRLTLGYKATYSPINNLTFESGITYVQSRASSGKDGYQPNDIPPYSRLADEFGNALPVDRITPTMTYRQSFLDTLGGGALLDWKYYPLTDADFQNSEAKLSHALINVGANYKPIQWLGLDFKYQYGRQQSVREHLWEEGSYFARDVVNQFSQLAPSGELIYNVPRGGVLDFSNADLRTHNFRAQLMVDHRWGEHSINLLFGGEASDRNDKGNNNRIFGFNNDILTYGNVNYLQSYPHFITGGMLTLPNNLYFHDRTSRFVSTFVNGSYSYRDKYMLSFSGRRDASNVFGVNTNDRWNVLWSIGLGWEVSKESFFHSDIIPYLRFRFTNGFSGNTDLSRSAVTTILYSSRPSYLHPYPYATVSQDANPDLSWERIRMTNFALDFQFKNNRVSGSFDFYLKHGTDLFGPAPIDYTTGIFNNIVKNVSELRGRGVDLMLNSNNIGNDKWSWNTNLNFSYYDDKVVRYTMLNRNPSNHVQTFIGLQSTLEGERLYSFYSHRWAGLDPETGNPRGYLDGQISTDYQAMRGAGTQLHDLTNHGSAIPLFYGSLGNTVRYKNFGLSVSMLFRLKYFVRTSAIHYNLLYRGEPASSQWSRRWTQPGDELHTNVPSMVYPAVTNRDYFYAFSEVTAERGDHIRVQYVNFFYDFESNNLRPSRLKNIRLYLNVSNLGIIWKKGGYSHDPNYGFNTLPPTRSYSLGLRMNF